MKNIIIDKALFMDVLHINAESDSFCTILNCSLVKLHENANLYVCVRAGVGKSCKLYIANNIESVDRNRTDSLETEWIEAIGNKESVDLYLCCKNVSGDIKRTNITPGCQIPLIAKSLCYTMNRLSSKDNSVFLISHKKQYSETDMIAFQKRSIVDLSTMDSRGVDIIYFTGADKLIEKLLYGGCREFTVFITEKAKAKHIMKTLNKLSYKAPFSNRIIVVVGENYAPKTTSVLLVGNVKDMDVNVPTKIFFSTDYIDGEGVNVFVGQNTEDFISVIANHRLKSHMLHYITSIMSELILHAISEQGYNPKRLFKINAKTLKTETIIKED